ncbi:protein shisa-4 isoform X1 [Vicugna pacos]|uniref:Protein shisa-4 isoform X1 n=1 Tax=Vicugna pacos TaxID=30538 RepID=A0ABM5C6S8_VICPA
MGPRWPQRPAIRTGEAIGWRVPALSTRRGKGLLREPVQLAGSRPVGSAQDKAALSRLSMDACVPWWGRGGSGLLPPRRRRRRRRRRTSWAGRWAEEVRHREALASEDCLWYLDRNGSWHPGFNCEFFTFCCGTCYQRYCCRDLTLLITERQQKHCLAFSPKTIAGIASAVILFVAVVATTICCFLCSCCYLYRRRQQLQSPFEGRTFPRLCSLAQGSEVLNPD